MKSPFANLQHTHPDGEERQAYVTNLFDTLAPGYDRFNRWVSFFQDEAWRRQTIKLLGDRASGSILDLATGTGDLARSALVNGATRVYAFDISHQMLLHAQNKVIEPTMNGQIGKVQFAQGSAHLLPFCDQSLDGVVSGFAMRNVFHFLDDVLSEIHRVLKPGGRFAILELSRPRNAVLRLFFKLHMSKVMPTIGRLATGKSSPFHYLCETTMTFLSPDEFRERLLKAGLRDVHWQSYLLGGISIHAGTK